MNQNSPQKAGEGNPYQASDELYQALFEQAADGIFIADKQGHYIEVNQRGCEMLGFTREELLDLTMQDLIPAEDLARDPLPLDELRAGTSFLKERRLRCRDGRLLPVEISSRMLQDGRFLGMVRDISKRKQAQELLYKREHEFRTLMENSPDFIGRYDSDGRIVYVNPSLEKLFGLPLSQLRGKTTFEITPDIQIQSARNYDNLIKKVLQTGSPVETELVLNQGQGQDIYYHHLRFVPERDQNGQTVSVFFIGRDITALKETEQHYKTLAENSPDIIARLDREGRYLYVNSTMEKIAGIPVQELLGRRIGERFTEQLAPVVSQETLSLRQAIEHPFITGKAAETETKLLLPTGEHIFNVRLIPEPNQTGEIDSLLLIARDITERKKTATALQESQALLSQAEEIAQSGTFDWDLKTNTAKWSPGMHRLFEIPVEQFNGDPGKVMSVVHPDDASILAEAIQNVIEEKKMASHLEYRILPPSGIMRHIWAQGFLVADDENNITRMIGVCHDITERKQAETEREKLLVQIQEQAQQVQNIIDTVPEGVILLSKSQFVTLANPVARHFLTLLAPEFQNGRLTQLGHRSLDELLTSPPKGLWHEIIANDLVFEAITRPVENSPENGGWVLVLRDITQERDIQQRVQRQERLAAVGQLAAGIAHDFNNILSVITLYAQLILRTVELSEKSRERLHTIERQSKRATDLIQQILDFSRQSILERQPLDLLPFIEDLVTLLNRTLPEHIQIELHHTAEAYLILADQSRIQQVMMNLAVNARDAMPEGGRLEIRLAHVHTDKPQSMPVQDLPPGDWIQIMVADSGEGIPAESLSHIFEPFFTTKEAGEGNGLGLAQVYGIIQQHEGYIDVKTEVGQGTTFFLYFAALHIGSNTMDTSEKIRLQSGQGQKILLVEDNIATREALQDSLAQLNYEVLAVTNGREALAMLTTKATDIDLVLSDVVMPEMGGIALFYAMQERNLTMPVVLLTGHPLSKEMENLHALGLSGWLLKPPGLASLSNLLATLLAD